MLPHERFEYVDKKVTALSTENSAVAAWQALKATNDERYKMFQGAAEAASGVGWSCLSMEKLSEKVRSSTARLDSAPREVIAELKATPE